jgi:enamine deaminase RidA (YjgF/YER057c/UK114 family)
VKRTCTVVVATTLFSFSALAETPRIEYLRPDSLLNFPGFSQIATASGGKLVFVSGQLAWDRQGKVQFPGDLEAQTRLAYENMRTALAAAGATFDDVIKFGVFVKNLDSQKWDTISKVRAEVLTRQPRPASTMVGVTGLVEADALIEIEAYALVKE